MLPFREVAYIIGTDMGRIRKWPARWPRKWAVAAGFCVLLWFGCGTQSSLDQRLSDSAQLSPPVVNVVLADPENYTFAIVGDLHLTEGNAEMLRNIIDRAKAAGDAFLILLGDIVDSGEEKDFAAAKKVISETGWEGKVFPVIGNHDIAFDGWKYYKGIFGPSRYRLSIGNALFLVVDSADGAVGRTQRSWLEEELRGSGAKNKFILSHYLPIIPGVQSYLKLANEEEGAGLMSLAKLYGVKGWLGAHYHSYIVARIEGTEYVVAGGGGGRRMEPVPRFFDVQVRVSGSDVSYEIRLLD